jgi:NADPH:quinone reductase-like Zn-dependent oxidoreductase
MPKNKVAYLQKLGSPLEIVEVPYISPGPGQITLHNRACAINPADMLLYRTGLFITQWPHILGCDSAGIVYEVGPGVTHVAPGDRVLAKNSMGIVPDGNGKMKFNNDEKGTGAFQIYSVVDAFYVVKIPEKVSFAEGCVMGLTMMTATIVLFSKETLGLEAPWDEGNEKKHDEFVLVWGGSSSVGSCATQLIRNAGYRVVAVCSAKNFEYCTGLGAEKCFDYSSPTVIQDVIEFLADKTLLGAVDAIGRGTLENCIPIAKEVPGSKKVTTVVPGQNRVHEGVEVVVAKADVKNNPHVVKMYREYLGQALGSGELKPKPDPLIIGEGLEFAQAGIETLEKGISARKVVFTLSE